MNIKDITYKIKCEIPNCSNLASIKIEKSGFFKSAGLSICDECMHDLYKELSGRIVPKSPENMLNKKIKFSKGESK